MIILDGDLLFHGSLFNFSERKCSKHFCADGYKSLHQQHVDDKQKLSFTDEKILSET